MASDDLKQALSASSQPDAGDHPAAEELVAYRHGELDALVAKRLRGHLARCESCTRVLLDLGGGARSDDTELDDAWRMFQDRLESESPDALESPDDATPAASPGTVPKRSFPLARLATAASLLLAIGATSLLLVQRREVRDVKTRLAEAQAEVDALQAPQLAVPSHTLLPLGFLRDGQEQRIDTPAAAPFLILTLAGAESKAFDRYRLVVVDASDAILWQGDGLARDDRGHFTVVMPSDLLPRVELELRVMGVDTGAGSTDGTVIARYRVNQRVSEE